MAFQLPPNITAQRLPMSSTSFQYVLHHSELGELGRVLTNADESGSRNVTYQVYKRSRLDNMMARRKAIFEPLAMTLAAHIRQAVENRLG